MGTALGGEIGNVFAAEKNFPGGGGHSAAEQVKECCLACSIGSDDGMHCMLFDGDADIIDSHQTAKRFSQVVCFKDIFLTHSVPFPLDKKI
jgi:hypothetical protein